MKAHTIGIGVLAGAVAISFGATSASANTEASLYQCQRTVGTQMRKLIEKKIKVVAACIDRVAKESVLRGATDAERAAKTCRNKMRHLVNTSTPLRTLDGKFEKKVAQACDPAVNPNLAHTADDVIGLGMPQTAGPLNAHMLGTFCADFGGDGSVHSIDEWIGCMEAAASCEANQAISMQFPRALEWIDLVIPSVNNLGDDQRVTDAISALISTNAMIEGPNNDNIPEIVCGTP